MATLKQVKALAKQMGATVEDDKCGSTHECRVQSPHRKHWAEGDVHELIANAYIPWKPDYADVLERMSYGLADCVGDCEWCDGE